jgi:hypothetical protein
VTLALNWSAFRRVARSSSSSTDRALDRSPPHQALPKPIGVRQRCREPDPRKTRPANRRSRRRLGSHQNKKDVQTSDRMDASVRTHTAPGTPKPTPKPMLKRMPRAASRRPSRISGVGDGDVASAPAAGGLIVARHHLLLCSCLHPRVERSWGLDRHTDSLSTP